MSITRGQSRRPRWRSAGSRQPAGAGADTASTATGLRRVDWVRLVVDGDSVRAEAVGMGYRLPTSRPIPLAKAAALMAAGTPSVTRTVGARPADNAAPLDAHQDVR